MRPPPQAPSGTDIGFPGDRWVPVREAARLANVDPRTIRRWADSGRIPARVTPGGHRQISVSGLGASYSPAKRDRNIDPVAVDPDVAVPQWVATSLIWHTWRPPRRLSEDEIALLRMDVRRLSSALEDLTESLTDELQDRDERAHEVAGPDIAASDTGWSSSR